MGLGHSDGGAATLRVYAGRVTEADRRAANLLASLMPVPDGSQRVSPSPYTRVAADLRTRIAAPRCPPWPNSRESTTSRPERSSGQSPYCGRKGSSRCLVDDGPSSSGSAEPVQIGPTVARKKPMSGRRTSGRQQPSGSQTRGRIPRRPGLDADLRPDSGTKASGRRPTWSRDWIASGRRRVTHITAVAGLRGRGL